MNQILTDYREKFTAITDELLTLAGTKKKLFIYPHISADGDALGSSLGLALLLAQLGIEARVIANEKISDKLSFLPYEDLFQVHNGTKLQNNQILEEQGIALAIDCAAGDRLARREKLFNAGPRRLVIDHHISELPDEPLILVNTAAAAVCEIITYYAQYLEERFERDFLTYPVAIALMTGLVTDTGRFSFSNTTAKTFAAASYLMSMPLPIGELTERLFDTISETKLRLIGITAQKAEFYYDKRMMIADLSRELLNSLSWVETDLEGLPSLLRNVDGVEVSVLLRQLNNGDVRGNIRCGASFDAQAFARSFGGGGHVRAAGFTINKMSLEEAKALTIKVAGEFLSTIKHTAEL